MNDRGRRQFLAGVAGSGALLLADAARAAAPPAHHAKKEKADKAEDIPPTEDLMREHGIVRRVLIVYGEAAGRLMGDDAGAAGAVSGGAALVRRFVEGYHEKLEEEFVLPALEKAGKLVELAKVIRAQHAAGRKLTDGITTAAKAVGPTAGVDQRRALIALLQTFARMYTAHAAYRALFTEAQLDELGEKFEEQEHKLLGASGFEGALKEVGALETALGIHDLAAFTPR